LKLQSKFIKYALPMIMYFGFSILRYDKNIISEKYSVDASCFYKSGHERPWKCYLDLDENGCLDTVIYDYDEDEIVDYQEKIEEICLNEKG